MSEEGEVVVVEDGGSILRSDVTKMQSDPTSGTTQCTQRGRRALSLSGWASEEEESRPWVRVCTIHGTIAYLFLVVVISCTAKYVGMLTYEQPRADGGTLSHREVDAVTRVLGRARKGTFRERERRKKGCWMRNKKE